MSAVIAALIAGIGAVNTLFNDFAYDDLSIVARNPRVTSPGHLGEIWTIDYWANHREDAGRDLLYRPIPVTSYRLDHLVWGSRPFGYHLTNLLLHALVTGLLVGVASRMGCSPRAALIAGLLFAVMPIHVEAVANVVGRAEIQVAVFTLLALLVVLDPGRTRAGIALRGLILSACLVAAVCSKENGITAAGIVVLYGARQWWASRRGSDPAGGGTGTVTACLIMPAVASAVMLLVYLPLRFNALGRRFFQGESRSGGIDLVMYTSNATRVWYPLQLFGMYLAKTFVPWTLCIDYSLPAFVPASTPWDPHVAVGLAGLAAMGAGCVLAWRAGYPQVGLCGLALLAAYSPVSSTLIKSGFAERFWYVPSCFGAILLGFWADRLAAQRAWRPGPGREPSRVGMIVLIAVMLAGLGRTWVRNAEWRDNGTLFAAAYRDNPESGAILRLYGMWLLEQGRLPEALVLLEKCVRVAPELSVGHLSLASAYERAGDDERALAEARAYLAVKPDDPRAQAVLGRISGRLKERRGAQIDDLAARYTADPGNLELFMRLTTTLADTGRLPEALDWFARAEPRFAGRWEYHRARATAFVLSARPEDALAAYRQALAIDGNQPEVLAEMATLLLDRRGASGVGEAGELLEKAVSLAPDQVSVAMGWAEYLRIAGRGREAADTYRRLIRQTPPGELRRTLEARLQVVEGR